MKATTPANFGLCIILLLATSCEQSHSPDSERMNQRTTAGIADTTMVVSPSESATAFSANEAATPLNEPSRKIIKTADLRCRVTDVYAATTRIEHLTNAVNGQIADSRLENVTEETRTLPYKTDSLRQVESFTTTAHLTLRIPVSQLDTVLTDIAAGSAFINNRSLHLDDVTLRYLSNKLKNEALSTNDAAQRARTLARRTGDAVYSGDYTDERNDTRIERRIENMQLTDQVAYATLTVDLYQPQRISQMILPDTDFMMKPTMGQQVVLALNAGWQLLRALLIGLLHIWPLLLLAGAGYFTWRYRRTRKVVPAVRA